MGRRGRARLRDRHRVPRRAQPPGERAVGATAMTDEATSLSVMPGNVLVVEDDDGIAAPLLRTLQREGYDVVRVAEGEPGVERTRAGDIGVVILDLGLPDIDGLDVCRRIREFDPRVGILILTARDGELDRVVGLDVG